MKKNYQHPSASIILPNLTQDLQDSKVVSEQDNVAEGKESTTYFNEDDTQPIDDNIWDNN